MDVKANIKRPLTTIEQGAIDQLFKTIASITVLIDALPDSAQIRMKDGSIITGSELKELWSKTDFAINESSFFYANGTQRGEAAYNGGNPQISFNIGTLGDYNREVDGITGVVFHEIGHMTQGSRSLIGRVGSNGVTEDERLLVERYANDVSKVLSEHGGFEVYPWDLNPTSGGFSDLPATLSLPDNTEIPEPILPEWMTVPLHDQSYGAVWFF